MTIFEERRRLERHLLEREGVQRIRIRMGRLPSLSIDISPGTDRVLLQRMLDDLAPVHPVHIHVTEPGRVRAT